jgi:hypothetical protein
MKHLLLLVLPVELAAFAYLLKRTLQTAVLVSLKVGRAVPVALPSLVP